MKQTFKTSIIIATTLLFASCGGWTDKNKKDFMESCENLKYEKEQCDCLLEKLMTEFSTFDDMQNDQEKMAEILTDGSCNKEKED